MCPEQNSTGTTACGSSDSRFTRSPRWTEEPVHTTNGAFRNEVGLDFTEPLRHKYCMAKLVDPTKLITLQQASEEFGYTAEYLRVLAVAGRLEAWLVGVYWVTTREAVLEYKKHSRPPGRPPKS